MSMHSTNWKTTISGVLAAFSMVAPMFPFLAGLEPVFKGLEAVAVGLFGYFASDKAKVVTP